MPEPTPTRHIKPTKEELEEKNRQIIEEEEAYQVEQAKKAAQGLPTDVDEDSENDQPLEEDKKDEQEDTEEEETEEEIEQEEEDKDSEEEEETEEESKEEEETPKAPAEEAAKEDKKRKELPPIEERYKESTQEAQKLYKDNITMANAIAEANNLPDPTDEEMVKFNPDFDTMSDAEKNREREIFIAKRFREHINEVAVEIKSIADWKDKVEKYAEDPQTLVDHPELEGKMEAFKLYAGDRSIQGSNFNLLVNAFLFEANKVKREKHKGAMFERGVGGPTDKGKPKGDKLSIQDSKHLAATDYRKYVEMLRAGKISNDVE